MKNSNAFKDFEIPISFSIDIVEIDRKFQREVNNLNVSEDSRLQITKSYSIIRNDILRGEEILKIFKIPQESIKITEEFFEYLMDINDDELTAIQRKIYEEISSIEISSQSIDEFSTLFMKYKYICKAFL